MTPSEIDDAIPAFLRLSPQERRAARNTRSKANRARAKAAVKPVDPGTAVLIAELAEAERVHKAAKKAAAKAAREYEIAHTKLARRIAAIERRQVLRSGSKRWDGRLGQYVEDR